MVIQNVRHFGKFRDEVDIPDLVAIQRTSYDRFLQKDTAPTKRKCIGLESLFQEIFPIESYDKNMLLEYLYYELEKPHYTTTQCRQLRLTYGYPLKITCRLHNKKKEDLKEQGIYLGEMPVMIGGGEFIINGAIRVIVSQLHRSPGVDFLIESKEGDRVLHGGRVIPERGSWIEIGVTHKDILVVKIDQSSKIPATIFLRAISESYGTTQDILRLFYQTKKVPVNKLTPTMWSVEPLVDPETGEIIVEAGTQISDKVSLIRQSSMDITGSEEDITQWMLGNLECICVPVKLSEPDCENYLTKMKEVLDGRGVSRDTNLDKILKYLEDRLMIEWPDQTHPDKKHIPWFNREKPKNSTEEIKKAWEKDVPKELSKIFKVCVNKVKGKKWKVGDEGAPEKPGLYIFRNRKDKKIVYVGETLNLSDRLEKHWQGSINNSIFRKHIRDEILLSGKRKKRKKGRVGKKENVEIEVIEDVRDVIILNTLGEDDCQSHEQALLKFYLRLRPGNPPNKEKARTFFAEKFFDSNRYRLGKVGRFRLNRKFEQSVSEEEMTLRPEDFLNTMKYILALRNNEGQIDDIDHLGNRRLRTIDELAADEIRKGLLKLRKTVQERMSMKRDAEEQLRVADLVNSKSVSSSINYFFGRGELSQVVDQTNALSQLTHERRLSALGRGGLNRRRAGFEVRDVHISHYGRICPIETPEGTNIGLIASLAIFAKIDEYGFLLTPYYKVKNGKVTNDVHYLRADAEMKAIFAPPSVLVDGSVKFNRREHLEKFYTLLKRLEKGLGGKRLFKELSAKMLPEKGVYFIFEPGENRLVDSSKLRVVRVGTHMVKKAKDETKATLWVRLNQHCSPNHQSSSFRRLVGQSLIRRGKIELPSWNKKSATQEERKAESEFEAKVTEYIREMSVLWLSVGDAVKKDSDRAFIEKNAISLVAGLNKWTEPFGPIDSPSANWLGRDCPDALVVRSCLWNHDYVDSHHYDPCFIEVFERYVDVTVGKSPAPGKSIAPKGVQGAIILKEGQVLARKGGELAHVDSSEVDYVDISSKQIVGVSASLIPFLEHDDANRALMGSNMQRQAVPLLKTEAPLVGTGMEKVVGQNSSMVIRANNSGVVTEVDATKIAIDHTDEYPLSKFVGLNERTCLNQKPIVKLGEKVQKNQIIADGGGTANGVLALGKNILVGFVSFDGFNFEDAIIISEKLCKNDSFTSIHIDEFTAEVRETRLGKEEFTCDIPNVSERALRNLDEYGVVREGTRVCPGDILVGKVVPKSKTELTPEEKLLHAIFGRAGEDVKNDSLELPSGYEGVVIKTEQFTRRGAGTEEQKKELAAQIKEYQKQTRAKECLIFRQMIEAIHKKFDVNIVDPSTRQKVGVSDDDEVVSEQVENFNIKWVKPAALRDDVQKIVDKFWVNISKTQEEKKRRIESLKHGDELPSGVLQMVKVYVAIKRSLSIGDKMAGRHGNKGVIAKIMPEEDMPFLGDGTSLDILLNPLGVPSRMNVGQILETHLGWVAKVLGFNAVTPVFNGATEDDIQKLTTEANELMSNRQEELEANNEPPDKDEFFVNVPKLLKTQLYDGRTGEPFDQKATIGYIYMMKLHHLVDDKIHARATGPYSLITQQPLGGKARTGGQRFGEMEVWALEGYGAAYTLQEMLTVKSDDVEGRTKIYESMVKGLNTLEAGTPLSFDVLCNEIRGLGLNIQLEKKRLGGTAL